MINFISENPLKAVSDHGFYASLSKWYRSVSSSLSPTTTPFLPSTQESADISYALQHSLNIVGNNHLVWDISGTKKPSKRFGNLAKSQVHGLNDMLVQHREGVQDFIQARIRERAEEVRAGWRESVHQ